MRSLIAVLSLLLCGCFGGCSSPCGGAPTMTLRSPVLFDQEPATVAGSRLLVGPPTVHELRVVESNVRCEPGARVGGYRVVPAGQ